MTFTISFHSVLKASITTTSLPLNGEYEAVITVGKCGSSPGCLPGTHFEKCSVEFEMIQQHFP